MNEYGNRAFGAGDLFELVFWRKNDRPETLTIHFHYEWKKRIKWRDFRKNKVEYTCITGGKVRKVNKLA